MQCIVIAPVSVFVGPCYSQRSVLASPLSAFSFLTYYINSFAADFLAPSAGKNIYVREIKLQPLTFVNTAITVANGTEGVLSTLVANGTGTVSTIVANGSERVKDN